MDNNQFLIPANSKKGQLIFGLFFPIDLAIFATGVVATIILLLVVTNTDGGVLFSILAILPAAIAVILVFPFPNYHNTRIILGEIIHFYSNNRNYKWRGWCSLYESQRK